MNTNSRLAIFAAVIAIIAVVAGTWFIGISPRLSEAASAAEQRVLVETQNAGHERTLAELKALDEELPSLLEQLEELSSAIPSDPGFADYLRQVEGVAASTGVAITVIGFDGPVLYAAPEGAPADAELGAAMGSVSPDNFQTITVSLQLAGSHGAVLATIDALQRSGRFVHLHDVSLPAGLPSPDMGVEATVVGEMFILREAIVTTPAPEENTSDDGATSQ